MGVVTGADRHGVVHAGTRRRDDGAIVASGGRVLSATATGDTLAAARHAAYAVLAGVGLTGAHHRTDIAARAVAGEVGLIGVRPLRPVTFPPRRRGRDRGRQGSYAGAMAVERRWDGDFALRGTQPYDEELPHPRDLDPPWVRRLARPAAAVATLAAGCWPSCSGSRHRRRGLRRR